MVTNTENAGDPGVQGKDGTPVANLDPNEISKGLTAGGFVVGWMFLGMSLLYYFGNPRSNYETILALSYYYICYPITYLIMVKRGKRVSTKGELLMLILGLPIGGAGLLCYGIAGFIIVGYNTFVLGYIVEGVVVLFLSATFISLVRLNAETNQGKMRTLSILTFIAFFAALMLAYMFEIVSI